MTAGSRQRAGRWRGAVSLCVERGGAGAPGSSDPTVAIAYLAPPRGDRDPSGSGRGARVPRVGEAGRRAGQRLPRSRPGPRSAPAAHRAARRHVLRGQRVRPAALGGAAQAGGRRGEDQGAAPAPSSRAERGGRVRPRAGGEDGALAPARGWARREGSPAPGRAGPSARGGGDVGPRGGRGGRPARRADGLAVPAGARGDGTERPPAFPCRCARTRPEMRGRRMNGRPGCWAERGGAVPGSGVATGDGAAAGCRPGEGARGGRRGGEVRVGSGASRRRPEAFGSLGRSAEAEAEGQRETRGRTACWWEAGMAPAPAGGRPRAGPGGARGESRGHGGSSPRGDGICVWPCVAGVGSVLCRPPGRSPRPALS